jgi:hypothetical protein
MEHINLPAVEILQRHLLRTLLVVGSVANNSGFSNEFCLSQIKEVLQVTKEGPRSDWERLVTCTELQAIPVERLLLMGFSLWDDSNLLLIPFWVTCFLDPMMIITSLSGTKGYLKDSRTSMSPNTYGFLHPSVKSIYLPGEELLPNNYTIQPNERYIINGNITQWKEKTPIGAGNLKEKFTTDCIYSCNEYARGFVALDPMGISFKE